MKMIVYKDASGEHRWKMVARNGKIIADSAEGYKKKSHAIGMAERVQKGIAKAKIIVED